MPRFFEKVDKNSTDIKIEGENANHIAKALRMTVGERLTLCDNGTDFECEITKISDGAVFCNIIEQHKSESEPDIEVTLYQCVPKADKMELIIQKAVELGVTTIVPVLSSRCVSRPDEKAAAKKILRYNKIALSACEQSGRGRIVSVLPMISFKQAAMEIHDYDSAIIFYEGGGQPLKSIVKKCGSACIFIGPEGGFAEEEIESAKSAGAVCATLGKRILRTETAPLAALTAIMLLSGNLE